MNQDPEISVIMPVFNESMNDLDKSIDSILNQTYRNFEYIIIDDNPLSKPIKEKLLMKAKCDSRIKLIFNKTNLGVIRSSNKGMSIAKGLYLSRMDADDIAVNNKLTTQLSFMKENHLDFVCSNFSVMNNKGNITREYGYRSHTIVNQNKIKKIFSHCNIAMGPTLFFKRKAFWSINGYRNTNVEDYDLASRFLINNYSVGYQDSPLIYKRLRKNSISYKTIFMQYIIMKNIGKILRKYDFNRSISLKVLKLHEQKISGKKLKNFNLFVKSRYKFNDNKTLKNSFYLLFYIIKSFTVINWCLWSIKNKFYQ